MPSDLSAESAHRHDHLSILADNAREAGLEEIAAIYRREAAHIRGEEIDLDELDGTAPTPTGPPADRIAVVCPGCTEELARLEDDPQAYAGRCGECDAAHTGLTTVAVPITDEDEDGVSVDVDVRTCRRALDRRWTDRVRRAVVAGELEQAAILSQFFSRRADADGWIWNPPSDLCLADLGEGGA